MLGVSCSCLQAKHYNAAASVLDQTIYDVEPTKTSMKPTDLLLYCYYGGMIHIGKSSEAAVGARTQSKLSRQCHMYILIRRKEEVPRGNAHVFARANSTDICDQCNHNSNL